MLPENLFELTPGQGRRELAYRVLLLYSESRLTPSVVSADRAFRSTLEARLPGTIHFYTEFLDLNVPRRLSLQRPLHELIGQKYRARPLDLVVAQGQLAVPFTMHNRGALFSSAPVVFVAVERSTFTDPSVASIATGTWRHRGWAETLDLARRFHPQTRRAVVIVGSSPGEQFWMEAARQQFAACAGSIEMSYLVDRPFEDIVDATAALPKDAVVLVGPFLRDGTGRDFTTPAVVRHIAAGAGVPVYGVTEASVGTGAVGGHVVSFEAHGRVAASLALRALGGERPSPTAAGTTLPMFDDREIKRWGIDRRRLPTGSVVLFQVPSRWERYGERVVGALGWRNLQRRAQQPVDDHLRFETFLSDLSAALSSCSAAQLDRSIEHGLRRILDALGVDGAIIWALDDRAHEARLTHAWTREALPTPPSAIEEREVPRALSRLRQGDVVRIPGSGDPSEEGQALARFVAPCSVLVPLFEGGVVVGGIALGTVATGRDWPDDLITRLRLLADVFAHALARQRAERAAHESAEHIRDLAGRLMTSQEEERRRIARELHDGVSQDLAALSIALNALQDALPAETASEQRRDVIRLQGRIDALAEAVRYLSHELHPGILQYGGLGAALRSHCREVQRQHGLAVSFRGGDDLGTVPLAVALCLYRVAQEALKNAATHAKPRHVWVSVTREAADLVLSIGDDGDGFDLAEARAGGGLGLISLDERVRLAGGRLKIDTRPQRGTYIDVIVPLSEALDAPPDHTAR